MTSDTPLIPPTDHVETDYGKSPQLTIIQGEEEHGSDNDTQEESSEQPEQLNLQQERISHDSWEWMEPGTFVQHDVEESFFSKNLLTAKKKLGELPATAISGNDIASSCLYVAGISVASGGKFAPLSLLLVTMVLYLFRNIYSEVGSALPLNGGSYNVLLNTTSKTVAALAGGLTILSYVATAVVSASEACEYAQDLYEPIDPAWATIALLGFFMILTLMGITESSVVATLIFIVHIAVLLLLIVFCTIWAWQNNWQILISNWDRPPMVSVPADLFYGYCSGLLGVSGFETSANYIEEQAPGVFPKTLRNMWIAVAILNPAISFLSLSLFDVERIVADQRIVLSIMGKRAAGEWLGILISVDATLVLSGAVLTSYVGITGLVHRMALDRLLPSFLLQKNSCRETNHWIIIGFFVVTSSLFTAVNGNVNTLSGVYTVSFLSVMSLFAVGNMLLKYKRARLPRNIRTQWPYVLLALCCIISALIGNIYMNLDVLKYFSLYFIGTMLIVFLMIGRVTVLKMVHYFARKLRCCALALPFLKRQVERIRDSKVVFFTHKGELTTLNKAIMYVRDNESTNKIVVVHAYKNQLPPKLRENVELLDKMYPKIRIDLAIIKGEFTPAFTDFIAHKLKVPKNLMFMACPSDSFPHNIGEFGGIRLVTH